MGTIRQILPNYTVTDYEAWEGRWELINGLAISMSPMASPHHQYIATKLARYLDEAIEQANCKKCRIYQPIDYKISDHTILNPDLLVVYKSIEGQYLTFPPELIVEILSPSTALKDRNTKYDLYEQEDVKYYIIIDPDTMVAEMYELDDQGKYNLSNSTMFTLNKNCTVEMDVQKWLTYISQ